MLIFCSWRCVDAYARHVNTDVLFVNHLSPTFARFLLSLSCNRTSSLKVSHLNSTSDYLNLIKEKKKTIHWIVVIVFFLYYVENFVGDIVYIRISSLSVYLGHVCEESWRALPVHVCTGLGKGLFLLLVTCKQLFRLPATVGDVFRFTVCDQTGCDRSNAHSPLNSCS